jgi:hypothetical protein
MARAEELEQQLKQAITAAGEQQQAAGVERAALESELDRLRGDLAAAQQRAVAAEAAGAWWNVCCAGKGGLVSCLMQVSQTVQIVTTENTFWNVAQGF